MKSKTVAVAFQLRVPAHLSRKKIADHVRAALENTDYIEPKIEVVSGRLVQLYRNQVVVLTP
jgi:hypothetical protein